MAKTAKQEADDKLRAQVKTMLGVGVPIEDVCRLTTDAETGKAITLERFVIVYRDEIATAEISANALVLSNLYKHATGNGKEAVKAALHWISTHKPKAEEDDLETRIKKALLMSERMMNRDL